LVAMPFILGAPLVWGLDAILSFDGRVSCEVCAFMRWQVECVTMLCNNRRALQYG
jgi:hypothetical protein